MHRWKISEYSIWAWLKHNSWKLILTARRLREYGDEVKRNSKIYLYPNICLQKIRYSSLVFAVAYDAFNSKTQRCLSFIFAYQVLSWEQLTFRPFTDEVFVFLATFGKVPTFSQDFNTFVFTYSIRSVTEPLDRKGLIKRFSIAP